MEMVRDFLIVGGVGPFFLCFGLYNWFHPFLGSVGLKIRVDPKELDPVRVIAVMMVEIRLVLLELAWKGYFFVTPPVSW